MTASSPIQHRLEAAHEAPAIQQQTKATNIPHAHTRMLQRQKSSSYSYSTYIAVTVPVDSNSESAA
jgi:hypothetical protein